jgi:hypothetical protein
MRTNEAPPPKIFAHFRARAAQHLSALPTSSSQIFSVRWCSESQAPPVSEASVASSLLSDLRFPIWCRSLTRHPTPIEALAPRSGVRTRGRSRPRNSVVPSYRPLHDGRCRRSASVVSRLGEGAASSGNAKRRRSEERGASHQTRALPDLWFLIARALARTAWRNLERTRSLTARLRRNAFRKFGRVRIHLYISPEVGTYAGHETVCCTPCGGWCPRAKVCRERRQFRRGFSTRGVNS